MQDPKSRKTLKKNKYYKNPPPRASRFQARLHAQQMLQESTSSRCKQILQESTSSRFTFSSSSTRACSCCSLSRLFEYSVHAIFSSLLHSLNQTQTVFECVCVFVCAFACIGIYIHTYIHTYIHMCIHICIHTYPLNG